MEIIKKPKKYQRIAVDDLVGKSKRLLNKQNKNSIIVFQSPTGSGKTFMAANYISELIKELPEKELCFVWLSIGKGSLHTQSYESLKKEFGGFPDCNLLEEEFFGSREIIEQNEVVVVNWEKIRAKDKEGKWSNSLMKDKEGINFRTLLKNTQNEGRTIVMIVDESHASSTSTRAIEIREEIIIPNLTIEMSATPLDRKSSEFNEKVEVDPSDVIEEGMIKKEIIINENFDKISQEEDTSQKFIMEVAIHKREELKKQYHELGIGVNPLVLIQLPTSEAGQDKREFIETFLAEREITTENKKLAIWLSEEKVNQEKDVVTPLESEVEFLIFKQAIDTGWDCPRAQILVRFREVKSISFEIQTVGRILRMPEAKHYLNENLNKAFVYVNTFQFKVEPEKYNLNIIKSIHVKLKDVYKKLKLRSYYKHRIDFGDITSSFYNTLEDKFCDKFGIKIDNFEDKILSANLKKMEQFGINLSSNESTDKILSNEKVESQKFDRLSHTEIKSSDGVSVKLSEEDLMNEFNKIILDNLNGFAPKRSVSVVRQAIYLWFRKYLNLDLQDNGVSRIQRVVFNNKEIFSTLLDQTIKEYKSVKDKEVQDKRTKLEQWIDNWEIENTNYNPETHFKKEYRLCIYEPCYIEKDSDTEIEFIEELEKHSDKILWWWKNGKEHMQTNFGIKVSSENTFQPDFLIMFKNGKIGIFDTKASEYNKEDTTNKAEALQRYIKEENKKGKKLFGGIIIKDGSHFLINSKDKYFSLKDKKDDWGYFKEVI